jgi:hypothetical protein
MRMLAVTGSIAVDGVISAGEGQFMPCGDEDVDQSYVREVMAP